MNTVYTVLDALLPWEMFSFQFMKNALLAVLLITPLLGVLGTMAVNNRMAFFSDALGHSALTGVALGVLLGIPDPLVCMVAFGVLLALLITRVRRSQTSSSDTIISVFASAAMALGLVILTQGGNFQQYNAYLVGDLLSIAPEQLGLMAITLVVVIALWCAIYNPLLMVSINAPLAASRGVRVRLVENVFVVMVAVVVVLAIRAVGILLINSLLILPAASARNVTRSTRSYQAVTVGLSMACGVAGLILSYLMDTAAGATIALLLAGSFAVTWFFRRNR